MTDSKLFTIREQNGRFCLFTKDGRRKLGCHGTREEAEEQERAIEAQKNAAEPFLEQLGIDADSEEFLDVLQFFEDDDDDRSPSRAFLGELRRRVLKLFEKKAAISKDDFLSAMRQARSSAGGKLKSRRRKRADESFDDELYEIASVELSEDGKILRGECSFYSPLSFAQVADGQWIPYLPVPGEYESPIYGTIIITASRNKRFVDNFENRVYQEKLPVDAEHETKLSGAVAWITQMRQNPDGSVDAQVEWTDRGKSMMANDRFKYFSPEFFDEWTDPATGYRHRDVAIGGALTTRPFFKESSMRPLVATEGGIDEYDDSGERRAHFSRKKEEPSMGTKDEKKTIMERLREVLGFSEDEDEKLRTELRAIVATEDDNTDDDQDDDEPIESNESNDSDQDDDKKAIVASEQVKALNEKLSATESKLKALTEKNDRLEKESRRRRFTEIVEGRTENSKNRWFGDRQKNVDRLEKLAEAVGEDSELFREFVDREVAHANQIVNGELFSERGYQGDSDSDERPEAKVAQEARKLMSEHPEKYPSIEQARNAVWNMHPEWKEQLYRRPRAAK